jgi:RNA recognition motif-containing protein
MSTHHSRPSGRRSGGRGPRRSGGRRSSGGSEERSSAPAPKTPEKKSLWQKIIGIFTPKKPSNGSARPRPEYQPRSQSSARSTSAPAATPRPVRKPEAIEVTSPKLYVGNLSFDATESDLFELFKGVGSVASSEIVSHKQTEKSKGFGFVTMASIEEAKRAVDVLHDKEFMGRKLVVSGAKTPVDRSE